MNVNDVLNIAVEYLNLDKSIVSAPQNDIYDKLLFCLNSVYRQTRLLYLPARELQKFSVTDKKIYYSAFSSPPSNILSVKQGDEAVAFKTFPSFLKVEAHGDVEVCFSTVSQPLEKNDDITFELKLSPDTLAFGVASEYAFINGLYEKANAFEVKFKEALRNLAFDSKERIMRKARWF